MAALDVERSRAEGTQALQALLKVVQEHADQREAHEAEQGIFTRRLPIGLAALQRSFAQGGTGAVGPAVPRADGVCLPREQRLRGRDDISLVGKFAVARTCDRTPGAPGIFPLDAQVNFPGRCDAYFLQEWMTVVVVEHPFQERSSWCEQLCDLEVAESVLLAVAQEAPVDDGDCDAQRPTPQEASKGERRVVRFDSKGVPLLKAEAVKLKAQLGTGEQRQKHKDALVGVSDTVDPQPRSPAALAELLLEPAAARARREREGATDDVPRAQQVRRVASLVRTKPAVMALLKADAERRDPQHRKPLVVRLDGALGRWHLATTRCREWKQVTFMLESMPVVGSLWSAANALFGDGSKAGKRWSLEGAEAILTRRSLKKSHDHALRDYWKFHARQVHRRLTIASQTTGPCCG